MDCEDIKEHTPDRPVAPTVPPARRVDLPARLDMNVAEEIGEALEHLRDMPLVVDASAVTQVSTLCVQVLLAARQQWDRDNQVLWIEDPSPTFCEALHALGVADDLLGDGVQS